MSLNWLRLAQEGVGQEFKENAHRAIDFVKQTQRLKDIDPAVRFIVRYKNLHKKVKERKHIGSFLATLQRAIIKHQMGKDNPYADEIRHIQKQLIKTLKLMKGEIKILGVGKGRVSKRPLWNSTLA